MIDVRRGQPLAADPDGQPGPARVLALDGQQPPGTLLGAGRGRTGQQLGGGPLGGDPELPGGDTTLARGHVWRGGGVRHPPILPSGTDGAGRRGTVTPTPALARIRG